MQLADATKAVLIGSRREVPGGHASPTNSGMHTFVVQLRDYTGTRVLKTSYMKIGVVKGTHDI